MFEVAEAAEEVEQRFAYLESGRILIDEKEENDVFSQINKGQKEGQEIKWLEKKEGRRKSQVLTKEGHPIT